MDKPSLSMPKQHYAKYVAAKSPRSPFFKNIVIAYCVGGGICVVGQLFFNLFQSVGFSTADAPTLSSVTLIVITAILTGLGWFDKIAKHAGAGTVVPITGFANAVVSPSLEFRTEGLVTGLAAKMFVIAGPVIVYGVIISMVIGIVAMIWD